MQLALEDAFARVADDTRPSGGGGEVLVEPDRILIGGEDDMFDADPEFDGEPASPAPAD